MKRLAFALGLAACSSSSPTTEPIALPADASAPELDRGAAPDASAAEPDAEPMMMVPEPDASFVANPDAGFPPVVDAGVVVRDRDPIVFIHGIGGTGADFDVMRAHLIADGWAEDELVALSFEDPRWGCNVDNAATIQAAVAELRVRTGAQRIDLVAHSMGVLSSRYYVKNLSGTAEVNTYVTLGGLHHGNQASCLNPLPVCVWEELCPRNPYLTQLNEVPATPGPTIWVSIFSTDDGTVPVESSTLMGAENIQVSGVPHAGAGGLLEEEGVYQEVKRVLEYPPW